MKGKMLVLLGWLISLAAHAEETRPNLLFITVDDMNWDSVGAFGCPVEGITPHMDRLAAEGMKFARAHVTVAICQPTRAVWMTGRYPHRNGALGFDPIAKEVPSLPEALKGAGYLTGLLGKERHVVPTRHAAFEVIRGMKELGQGREVEKYREAVREFLARAKAEERSFFLMANAHDPHRPFAGSDQEKWRPRPVVRKTYTPGEVPVPGFLPDLPEVRQELAEYFTSVHRADEVVGAVLEELEAAGMKGNTLVVFVSDHGMPLPFAKTNCYYDSTRTPMIVRWPGVVEAGSENKEDFVSGIDVAPTFLAAAGLPNLAGADGESIVPLLKGGKVEGRNKVFTMINTISGGKAYPMRAVQDERYLYIWNGWADGKTEFKNESQSGRTMKAMNQAAKTDPAVAARVEMFVHRTTEELYDLQKDPSCLKNLLDEKGGSATSRSSAMTKALWHWMKDTDDPQRKAFEGQVELALD